MHALNPVLRVGHQVAEPLLIDGGMPKSQAYERVHELMEKVGLPSEVFQRYPHELSGGMKQRVVTAMALVQYPKLVVLDEPTSALDVSIQAQITNLLKQLKQALGLSFIFITHDIAPGQRRMRPTSGHLRRPSGGAWKHRGGVGESSAPVHGEASG